MGVFPQVASGCVNRTPPPGEGGFIASGVRPKASKKAKKGRPMQLRILVVDDSKTTRRVLSPLVWSRWTVCGEAENGASGVTKFRELKPDVVVLDLAMPDIDGIEAG